MKKLSAVLLCAVIILSACHNEGSSTVADDSNEPARMTRSKEGHEDAMKRGEHETVSPQEHMDTAQHAMPSADSAKH